MNNYSQGLEHLKTVLIELMSKMFGMDVNYVRVRSFYKRIRLRPNMSMQGKSSRNYTPKIKYKISAFENKNSAQFIQFHFEPVRRQRQLNFGTNLPGHKSTTAFLTILVGDSRTAITFLYFILLKCRPYAWRACRETQPKVNPETGRH